MYLARTVLDDDESVLPDGARLLGVCQRSTSVGRLEVNIVMLLSLRSQPVRASILPQANFAAEQRMHGGARTIMDACSLRSTLLHLQAMPKEARGRPEPGHTQGAMARVLGRCAQIPHGGRPACFWCQLWNEDANSSVRAPGERLALSGTPWAALHDAREPPSTHVLRTMWAAS